MPAAAPSISKDDHQSLARLGERLRLARKQQGVSAVAAAESAGISRVTLHRVERGSPNVAIGTWAAVAGALGLSLELGEGEGVAAPTTAQLPASISLQEYPQLRHLAWQLGGVQALTPAEALALYERNWRHVDRAALTAKESELIASLSRTLAAGRLLV